MIKGIESENGAIASTVAHDNHNSIIVGTDDESMAKIANIMRDRGGGIVTLWKDQVSFFPFPIERLMSNEPF